MIGPAYFSSGHDSKYDDEHNKSLNPHFLPVGFAMNKKL